MTAAAHLKSKSIWWCTQADTKQSKELTRSSSFLSSFFLGSLDGTFTVASSFVGVGVGAISQLQTSSKQINLNRNRVYLSYPKLFNCKTLQSKIVLRQGGGDNPSIKISLMGRFSPFLPFFLSFSFSAHKTNLLCSF